MTWIIISIINCILAYYAEKNYIGNKHKCKIYLFLIVVVNVIVFGLRDIGVGIDTTVYIEPYFRYASDISSVFDLFLGNKSDLDSGYVFLAWISALLSNDSHTLLFISEMFIVIFLVLGMYELKKSFDYSMTFFMILFVILYQEITICLMRHYCASVLTFYGFTLFLQKKYRLYFIFQLIAYFFHSTSIVFVLIPTAYVISNNNSNMKKIYLIGCAILLTSFIAFYYYFLDMIFSSGLIKDVYADRYGLVTEYSSTDGYRGIREIIINICSIIMYFIIYNDKNINKNISYMYLYVFVMYQLFLLFDLANDQLHRLAYFFGFILISYLSNFVKRNNFQINLLCIIIVLFHLYGTFKLFYYDNYYNNKNDKMLIYKSKILGINEERRFW